MARVWLQPEEVLSDARQSYVNGVNWTMAVKQGYPQSDWAEEKSLQIQSMKSRA